MEFEMTDEITSRHALAWAKRVEAQRTQKTLIKGTK